MAGPSTAADEQYADTPAGWADRWKDEFAAAKPQMLKFHKAGDKVFKRFLGEESRDNDRASDELLNLFYSNTVTVRAMLYGQLPKAEVDRTFADAKDDVARVASEILERMLNQDIQNPGNDFRSILRNVISDRLIPGLGCARVKYDYVSQIKVTEAQPATRHPVTGVELTPEIPETQNEEITEEWVDTVYTHWKDILWSPARTHAELRWKAFRAYMTKDELRKRFAKDDEAAEPADDEDAEQEPTLDINIDAIPLTSKGPMGNADKKQVAPQAEVWEIWNLENRKVYWYVENFPTILDVQEDPFGLDQFWPEPPPMIANTTTNKYIPKSDYAMSQDLYAAIDVLETRIARLTEACKLVGVYDKQNDEVKRLFNEGVENQLIPVDNWALFAEKGGLDGTIEWLPIEAVTLVIEKLTELQTSKIQQLYQLTGLADVLRGGSQQAYTSAEETKAKVQFASVRIQELQDEFSTWVSNLQNLKAEIICKHFQPQVIIAQSNIMNTADADLAQQAVEFLKSDRTVQFRIKVQPESMATADYQQMKADRTDFMMAMSQFMQSAAPLVQIDQEVVPFLLQLLQWGLAGFKGAQQIEGVMDQMIKAYQLKTQNAAAQQKPPSESDIKIQLLQAESQAKIQILQQQAQSDQQGAQAKQQMEFERASADHQAYLQGLQMQQQLEQQKFQNAMELAKAELVVNLAKLSAQQKADVGTEAIKLISTAEQTKMQAASDTAVATHGAALEMASDTHKAETQKQTTQHAAETAKDVASHAASVQAKSKDSGNGADKST